MTKTSAGFCVAGTLAVGITAAVAHAQQAPQPQTQPSTRATTEQQVTITGCVQREADYRQARDAGKGGVAGTGVGAGNEYVLTEASSSTSASGAADTPTGTSGSAARGSMAYELTGPGEGQLTQYVGRRVEIVGRVKPAETTAAGSPTGGATAGAPPSGVDATSKDLKLRELEVMSAKEATGACTPAK